VNPDEQTLVKQAQQGNVAAFEALVTVHATLIYNLAYRTLNNPQEAEDVAQEALVRAWQGLPRFQAKAQFSTWLYRIVINLCYNRLPRLKIELMALDTETAVTLPDTHAAIETGLLSEEMKEALHNAIDSLPVRYRLLIILRHLQEMSYAEIAAVTDMPIGTVKTGIFRARLLLRERLEEMEESYER
jgi:RNA polymerase sigma-70 factor (ECF subfamily)